MPPKITRVRWSASNLPWGVSFDEGTGTFSGTPEDIGEYTIPVTVETNYGISPTENVMMVVDGWEITPSLLNIAEIHYPYSCQLQTIRSDNIVWQASGLPTGLFIDSTTGLISGQIDDERADDISYPVKVYVYDSTGIKKAQKSYTLLVRGMYPHLEVDQSFEIDFPCTLSHYNASGNYMANMYYAKTSSAGTTRTSIITVVHGTELSEGVTSYERKYQIGSAGVGGTYTKYFKSGSDDAGEYNVFSTTTSSNGDCYKLRFLTSDIDQITGTMESLQSGKVMSTYSTSSAKKPEKFELSTDGTLTITTNWGTLVLTLPIVHYFS